MKSKEFVPTHEGKVLGRISGHKFVAGLRAKGGGWVESHGVEFNAEGMSDCGTMILDVKSVKPVK